MEITAKREHRVSSKGATNLPLEIKDTPQTISTIDKETLRDFGATGSNDALKFGTGITVDEWETNRTSFSARGFDVMLTQVDGLGMTNDWGLVEGQLDTYVFERIELIRGANGLLTGVGNASGTVNYVRKRPTNNDGGEVIATAGSNDLQARGDRLQQAAHGRRCLGRPTWWQLMRTRTPTCAPCTTGAAPSTGWWKVRWATAAH